MHITALKKCHVSLISLDGLSNVKFVIAMFTKGIELAGRV